MLRVSLLLLVLSLLPLAGCNSPDQDGAKGSAAQSSTSLLENALTQLREEKPTVAGYRNAVQQLNIYMDQPEQPVELKLNPETRKLLLELLARAPESARRLKELEAKSFTVADANHLDACLLFRDAARTLLSDVGPPPDKNDDAAWKAYNLLLVGHVFDWTMRQVSLAPRVAGSDPWPAHDILRRGVGDGEERLRVFLSLLEQLNLFRTEERRLAEIETQLAQKPDAERQKQLEKEKADLEGLIRRHRLEAGAVTRQTDYIDEDGSRKTRELPWAAGVLIGGELCLYETRLGRPIPGPDGKGVCTWKQLQQQPKLLESLYQGDADPVTPAQLQKSELQLAFSLPALAPRMDWLESKFGEGVLFHQDPPARFAHLAAANLGLPVRAWSKPGAPGYPLIVLNQYVENPGHEKRLRDLIVPRYLLPDWVQELLKQLASPRDQQRLLQPFEELFLRVRVEPGGVRDLVVRGRPDEAIQRIVIQEERMNKALDAANREFSPLPNIKKEWVPLVIARSRRIAELQLQLRTADEAQRPELLQQLSGEVMKMELLWKDRAAAFSNLAVVWAAPEYRAQLTYLMALAKMDLARRAELRKLRLAGQPWPADQIRPEQLWTSARDWLQRYQAITLTLGKDPWQAAVARQLEVCRAALAAPSAVP